MITVRMTPGPEWALAMRWFAELPDNTIKPICRTALRDSNKGMARKAKTKVQKDTGETQKWIKVRAMTKRKRGAIAMSVISSSKNKNVITREFGNSEQPGQPYLRPTADEDFPHIVANVGQAINRGLTKKLTS